MPWTLTFNHRPFQVEPQGVTQIAVYKGVRAKELRPGSWVKGLRLPKIKVGWEVRKSPPAPGPLSLHCLEVERTESGERPRMTGTLTLAILEAEALAQGISTCGEGTEVGKGSRGAER